MDVRFASLCDAQVSVFAPDVPGMIRSGPCGARSREYTSWPECRECGDSVCRAHEAHGSRTEDDGRIRVTCVQCKVILDLLDMALEEDACTT